MMWRSYALSWRRGILFLLFPVSLLLPSLHLHPAYEHTHGVQGAHRHAPVAHADFFPLSAHDHGEHPRGHDMSDDTPSQPFSQIKFLTLLSRSLVFCPPAVQGIPISLPVAVLAIASPFLLWRRLLTRDHAPPGRDTALSLVSSRSPPRFL